MRSVDEVTSVIGKIPYMTSEQANIMTDLITTHQIKSVLELGFYHGASTCYIANALSDMEGGSITCVDRERAKTLDPNVEDLLEKLGLRDLVQVYYEPNSYIWRLMKMLEDHPEPVFDLCYIDGAHNWFTDGFAFFLADRLLKPGGWMVLDDLNWSYADSPTFRNSETLMNMPEDERECYQLRKVFELLVQRQPGYGNFREEENWALAQKITVQGVGPARMEKITLVKEKRIGIGEALIKLGRRFGMR